MRRLTQIICVLLVASMILAIPGFAAERASNYFGSHSSYLYELSDSEFEIWYEVTAVQGMDVLGVSEIKVQRSSDRVNWTTVATYGGRYGYNTSVYGGHMVYSAAESGYFYRAKITYYAKKGTGTAEYIDYTSSI